MVTATLASFRRWWPELLCAALLAAIGFAHSKGAGFLAIFCAVVLAIGWMLGFRHRHHPALDAIQETYRITKRLEEADAAAREPARPNLRLISRD